MSKKIIAEITTNRNFKFDKNAMFNALIKTSHMKSNELKISLEINSPKFDSLLIHLIEKQPREKLEILYPVNINENKGGNLRWIKLNFIFFVFNPQTKVNITPILSTSHNNLNKEVHIRKVIFCESSKHNIHFSIKYLHDSIRENTIFEESFIDLREYKDVKDIIFQDYLSYVHPNSQKLP